MKPTFILPYFLAITICFYNFSCNDGIKSKDAATAMLPQFADNGKTIDSLKTIYDCENIEYNNWKDDGVTDSCLTVCFINSNKGLSLDNVDYAVNQLKGIALSIKNSLANAKEYNSYYLIFIKKDNFRGMETRVPAGGMEIPSSEL